jgi:drug/metabolite transporter (DMT)-like permease
MSRFAALSILLFAAVLEAGGDALIRSGMQTSVILLRVGLFAAGASTLFLYGLLVNAAPWDFGRLIGIYVVFFFLVAQVVAWATFRETPSAAVLAGGALIVLGGLILARG